MRKRLTIFAVALPSFFLFLVIFYHLPPVHSRLSWRVDQWRTEYIYRMNPPEEAVFIPQEMVDQAIQSTLLALTPSATPSPTPTATVTPTVEGPTSTPEPSPTSTLTPTPLPQAVKLEGVKYEDQHGRWNYCGPANLSMALTFWGWEGNRDVVGRYVKPNDKDKNVMPYEMQIFVENQTQGLGLLIRSGGTLEVVKRLVAAGFPVLAEKGYYTYDLNNKYSWLGHYQLITGYDDDREILIVQDSYLRPGKDRDFPYSEFIEGWRAFNYLFMVAYPVERQAEVFRQLGSWGDPGWADRFALETAEEEIQGLTDVDLYFAWFNKGTSHVNLFEYADAAAAYDQAFRIYAELPNIDLRPFRMLWYQTGPYKAYYYSGRLQDTIDLADQTLYKTISEPVLEESFYWRALAKEAKGDIQGALADLHKAVEINPNFFVGWNQIRRIQGDG
jgi:tetratricopeptide (TPR) repeat protein